MTRVTLVHALNGICVLPTSRVEEFVTLAVGIEGRTDTATIAMHACPTGALAGGAAGRVGGGGWRTNL